MLGLFNLIAWSRGKPSRLRVTSRGRLALAFLRINRMSLVLIVQHWLLLGLALWTMITVCLGRLVIVVCVVFIG